MDLENCDMFYVTIQLTDVLLRIKISNYMKSKYIWKDSSKNKYIEN